MDFKYDATGKFIVYNNIYREEVMVPVSLIDEINERKLGYSLENLLTFRNQTFDSAFSETVYFKDLVGRDLTGLDCNYYFGNYDDSEWLHSNKIVGVKKLEDSEDSYELIFTKEATDFLNEDTEVIDNDERYDLFYEEMNISNFSFRGYDRLFIVKKK